MREIERQEIGRTKRFEGAGLLGCDCEIHPEPPSRVHERAGTIGGGGEQQEKPGQATSWRIESTDWCRRNDR
jgi:hypothetical protein